MGSDITRSVGLGGVFGYYVFCTSESIYLVPLWLNLDIARHPPASGRSQAVHPPGLAPPSHCSLFFTCDCISMGSQCRDEEDYHISISPWLQGIAHDPPLPLFVRPLPCSSVSCAFQLDGITDCRDSSTIRGVKRPLATSMPSHKTSVRASRSFSPSSTSRHLSILNTKPEAT